MAVIIVLAKDMIIQIREQIHDISNEYSDEILLKYINTGIKSASNLLIAAKHCSMMEKIVVEEGMEVPKNFVKFAGFFPVSVVANRFYFFDKDYSVIEAIYYCSKEIVKNADESIPFSDDSVLLYIEQYAIILALNRNEFDVSTDNQILKELESTFLTSLQT